MLPVKCTYITSIKGINNLKISNTGIRNGCNLEEIYMYQSLLKVISWEFKEVQWFIEPYKAIETPYQ